MGIYLNPGNDTFSVISHSKMYIDKTGIVNFTNNHIGEIRPYIASSRPRRFGKTIAAETLAAYYSKGCDSEELFSELKIAQYPSFKKYLNKFDVIFMDLRWMYGDALAKKKVKKEIEIIPHIQSLVIDELRNEFADCVADDDVSLPAVLARINDRKKQKFVIIIDEWDCIFREDKNNQALQEEYIDLLRGLFKGAIADRFVALAYITGILPIKKYGTQSALNNFREFTMLNPMGMAEYIGFTESEVSKLCEEYDVPFDDMQQWYDGYSFRREKHIYCPNSVVEAITNEEFNNYWTKTETYELLKSYIAMDFKGLKQKIVEMLAGNRCKINTNRFQNDMTTFEDADDVLTLLIHLGYL